MNEATKNAIKKFDETCEKIAKNEPKVWLTVDEAKHLNRAITKMMAYIDIRKFDGFLYAEAEILSDLDNRIEKAEVGDDR